MDFVVDIETPDNRPTSAILSIGCAALNRDGAVQATFYTPVSLKDCLNHGLTMGASTIGWWMEQSEEARQVWKEAQSKDAPTLAEALKMFSDWMDSCSSYRDREMWGNGSDFDNVIIANACSVVGMGQPWPFWGNDCFRTLKKRWKKYVPEPEFVGVKHNAKDDAVHEAVWLARIKIAEEACIKLALSQGLITPMENYHG